MALRKLSLIAAMALTPALALAADPPVYDEPPQEVDGTDLDIELGIGGIVQPRWEGSDEFIITPYPIIALNYFSISRFSIGGGGQRLISVRPDFAFRGERKESDDADLVGLGDTDLAVELGGAVVLRYQFVKGELALRYGIGGHSSIIGEANIQGVAQITDRWTVSAGPEITFAGNDYMDTYFGVNATQAAASGLAAYNPSGGIKSAGIIADTRYRVTENLSVLGRASWHHLVGDASDSPVIARAGQEDQFTIGAGLSYRFRLDLY